MIISKLFYFFLSLSLSPSFLLIFVPMHRFSIILIGAVLVFSAHVVSRNVPSHSACPDSNPPIDTDKLEAVFVFMRHGVRAPWTTYPKDPHANQTAARWPNGRSQLTPFGITQARTIGSMIGSRYGRFLRSLGRSQIYLRASAAQRCIDTLNLVAEQVWNGASNPALRPMVYSLPKTIDPLLYEEPKCPQADEEEARNMNSPSVSAYENLTQIKDLYSYVAENTGLPPTMSGVTKAFDCVRCEMINGYDLPKWAMKNNVYDRMGQVYTKNLNSLYSSEKARRFRAGPMLQEVIDSIDAIKNAKKDQDFGSLRRAYFYTTHDYKIAALLLSLGEPLYRYPPFAATIIFEVHRAEKDYIIRAYYISQTVKKPFTIEHLRLAPCLGDADYECKYENFVNYLRPLQNVSWTEECGLKNFDAIQAAEDNIGNS